MEKSIILGLVQNTAILLAFSMIYQYSWVQSSESKSIFRKIFTGIVIGTIGLALMLTPWKQVSGLVFDTRSVLLSLSGLFFGFIPTLVAALITATYRAFLGGIGVWMGIAVIFLSSATGILWRRFRPIRTGFKFFLDLALLGYTVHLLMLACIIFLPLENRAPTINNLIIPLLTIYPAGTVILGFLMGHQASNWKNRNAATKLAESDRRFREMLTNSLFFSVIVDSVGNVTFINEAVLKVSGYTREELVGKNAFENFILPGSLYRINELFYEILSGISSSVNFEAEIRIKDGSNIYVLWNATVLKDEFGKVEGVACIGENITLRKEAERELIRAKNKAEESDRLKSVFLSNMSHEIRTPMNAIMGFSNLLADPDLTGDEKQQYTDIIRNSGDRLLRIINDIIDISKLEAKQLTVTFSECNLDEIFRNCFEACRRSELMAQKTQIELVLTKPPANADLRIMTDCNRFQQILDNLLTNAIKYTHKGKIEFGYSITNDSNAKLLEVFVKDTGIGIPENMRKVIFERFRQVEEGSFHEGAGLGLSISKGIVELLGGKIWVESKQGKGSVFRFTLPYKPPESVSDIKKESVIRVPDLNFKSVIIAEDDHNSFLYLKLLVEEMNGMVIHADDGLSLMAQLEKNIPDVILLDLNMPGLSGYQCLEQIEKMGIRTNIIAQTAYSSAGEREKCLRSGCVAYIAKPVTKPEFFKVMNQVFPG